MNNPEFIVYTGCMFSSKTSNLLARLDRYKYQKKTVMVFKPCIEQRYDETKIVSHCGGSCEAIKIEYGTDIYEHLKEVEHFPDVIAVDEAFMIPEIADNLIWLYRNGISIIISSLDLSHSGKSFLEIRKILPWATEVHKCTAVCTICGDDAHYTHKKVGTDVELEIGGDELYEPRCFKHCPAINKREKI